MHLDAYQSIGCMDLPLRLTKFSSSYHPFERFRVKVEVESLCLPPSMHRFDWVGPEIWLLENAPSFRLLLYILCLCIGCIGCMVSVLYRCCVDAYFLASGHFWGVFAETSHWTINDFFHFSKMSPLWCVSNLFFMLEMKQLLYCFNCGNWIRNFWAQATVNDVSFRGVSYYPLTSSERLP